MSFGYGNGTRTEHRDGAAYDLKTGRKVAAVLSNHMVSHVWAHMGQTFGRSGNGNFYFRGRTLFSYGTHYAAGFILPEPGTGTGRGVVLINSESRSISTSGHVRAASSAAVGRSFYVPNLTDLADIFASSLDWNRVRTNPGTYPAEYDGFDIPGFSASIGPRLERHFANPDNVPDVAALAEIFRAACQKNPDRLAEKTAAKAARTVAETAAKAARDKRDAALSLASEMAATAPAEYRARIKAAAIRAARSDYRADSQGQWANRALEAFRAAKAAKAAGRVRIAAKVRAVRSAILESLSEYDAAATRNHYLRAVGRHRENIRQVTGTRGAAERARLMADVETVYRGRGGPNRNGPGHWADLLTLGASSAAMLAGSFETDSRMIRAARIMGHDPAAMAAKFKTVSAELDSGVLAANVTAARLKVRDDVAKIRAARAALIVAENWPNEPGPISAELMTELARVIARLGAGRHVADNYSGQNRIPRPFVLAGFTVERFRAERSAIMAAMMNLESIKNAAERAARAERDAAERAARAERDAATLAQWLTGAPCRGFYTTAPDGSAYVRAVDIERDAAGNITGGLLETSQGAEVPLAHAIKVFKFVKLCRDSGREWQSNGRALRAGPFKVDSIGRDGSFRAGCHAFQWAEIVRLAGSLGLSELAGADTTESTH